MMLDILFFVIIDHIIHFIHFALNLTKDNNIYIFLIDINNYVFSKDFQNL